ncbi:MAG: alpha/beta hydrolase [Bacteroidetes bacterium]|nr:alpha/beta hydrolase [Bacteroidota bacterium]
MKLSQRIALGYIRTKFKLLATLSKKKAAEQAFTLFCTPQSRNKKKIPEVFEKAEKLSFVMEGITVRGWRFNHDEEDKNRRKALIIHGFESSVINFDRYIKPLIKKGYEVLAFDAPAHGRSGGKQINAPLYQKTIQTIYQHYGPIQAYLAHSFGGLAVCLALENISHTPDYRLALVAPATETTSAINSFFHFLQLDPGIRPEFEKLIVKKSGLSSEWFSINRTMRHIKAHVLWHHDEEDEITPYKDVQAIQAQNHPHIQFVITKGLGHRRIYRDNKVSKAIVEFL